MNRAALFVIALAIALGPQLASIAAADDTFEAMAKTAQRARHLDEIVWALTAPCDRGDDVQQRQCRLIRDKREKSLVGDVLWVSADPAAFEVGKWNATKRSVSVTVTSCVACKRRLIDGKPWYVTGSAPRVEGGNVRASVIYDNGRQFSDEAAANAWIKSLRNVQVEMLVKIPQKRRWQVSGKDGLLVDVVGYRVLTPCDGGVIVANPESGPVSPDRKACITGGRAASEGGEGGEGGEGVEVLTAAMVQLAMKPVVDAARACFDTYGVSGNARLEITIAGDGTITKYDQTGDFGTTPTGQCIDTAMREVQFPRSKRSRTKIVYPIVVQ